MRFRAQVQDDAARRQWFAEFDSSFGGDRDGGSMAARVVRYELGKEIKRHKLVQGHEDYVALVGILRDIF